MNVAARASERLRAESRERIEDQAPALFADASSFWRFVAQAATIVMAVLLFGICLFFARAFLLPILCAVVVGMTLGPLIGAAERNGVPAWAMACIVILSLIALVNIAVLTLAKPISDQMARAPELGLAIKEKLHVLDRPLGALRDLQAVLGLDTSGETIQLAPSRLLEGMVTVVTPAVLFAVQVVMFFATLFFFIIGRRSFRQNVVIAFTTREARLHALKILNDIEESLSNYLRVVTAINLALGAVTAGAAYLMGLPAPLLWGALAFVLNYVPYVGPATMYVLLFIIGLLSYPTLVGALVPPGIFMLITLIEGQFLTPSIVGRQVLRVNPLAVFLSIAFWAWLWGPVGAFLATPLLIIACVVLEYLHPGDAIELPA